MPNTSATSWSRALLFLPFGYAFATRYHWPRDFMVNLLTAWVPGVILLCSLVGLSPLSATVIYALGYLAFISVYEIGYLANDSFGLRHDPTPRRRIDLAIGPIFVLTFGAIRIAVVLGSAIMLGVEGSPVFWAALGALVLLLIAHNTLRAVELKFYTFLQLSLLRFALPVLPVLLVRGEATKSLVVFATGLLLFSLPRFLTYLDAKGRLTLPERKALTYHLNAHLMVAPLLALTSYLTSEAAPVICLVWAIWVQLVYVAQGRRAGWVGTGAPNT